MTHWRKKREERKLWEVTLVSLHRPITKRVKVLAWTGAEAELKAIEVNPDWRAIIKHTNIIEER
jgi:hypothetical protein